jgi:hypothetical protein
MIDIRNGVAEIEISEVKPQKDALIELAEPLYFFAQLGLPDKKYREKVLLTAGEIGEILYFVKYGIVHLLGLVKEDHQVTLLFIAEALEPVAEEAHEREFVVPVREFALSDRGCVRVLRNGTADDIEQKIIKGVVGIFKIDYSNLVSRQGGEKHVPDERLAGTDLPGQEADVHVPVVDNITHPVKRLAVALALEEKSGIGYLFKGFLGQFPEFDIPHSVSSPCHGILTAESARRRARAGNRRIPGSNRRSFCMREMDFLPLPDGGSGSCR